MVCVHLCGTLALKAVELYNRCGAICFFALKPCCLPGRIHAQRGQQWQLGSAHIVARDLYNVDQNKTLSHTASILQKVALPWENVETRSTDDSTECSIEKHSSDIKSPIQSPQPAGHAGSVRGRVAVPRLALFNRSLALPSRAFLLALIMLSLFRTSIPSDLVAVSATA